MSLSCSLSLCSRSRRRVCSLSCSSEDHTPKILPRSSRETSAAERSILRPFSTHLRKSDLDKDTLVSLRVRVIESEKLESQVNISPEVLFSEKLPSERIIGVAGSRCDKGPVAFAYAAFSIGGSPHLTLETGRKSHRHAFVYPHKLDQDRKDTNSAERRRLNGRLRGRDSEITYMS